jgi:small subunit ribosomal protein S15
MARMYSRGKGKSRSHKPPFKIVHRWLKGEKAQVEKLIIDLAKQNYTSAMIGTILRDQHGIPDVKAITGKSITQIMKENNLYPEYPEDLLNLFRKLVMLEAHLKANKMDKRSKHAFENLESKVRKLINYYKRENKIPKDFVYDLEKIKLIVQK